jgi:hypothetical protein
MTDQMKSLVKNYIWGGKLEKTWAKSKIGHNFCFDLQGWVTGD